MASHGWDTSTRRRLEIRTLRTVLRAVFALGACCAPTVLAAETPAFPRGQIVPRVVCENNSQQSYALYLPSNFVATRKWPILYAFDPGARGSVPLEVFKAGAEKLGYIVVGSNNSQNGPMGPSIAAAQALWIDTHARFPIDDARVYSTGFSGGGHVATRMALMLSGRVAGVIVSGGALLGDIEPPPTGKFAFYGLSGIRDFNLIAMKQLDQKFAALGFTHRLEVFEGVHQWPPPEACTAALEWMEIQALKSGQPPRDDKFLKDHFDSRLKKAETEQAAGRLSAAFHQYEEIAEDFRGLLEVSAIATKIDQLRSNREYQQITRQEEKREQKREKQDLQNFEKASALVAYLLSPAASPRSGGRDFAPSDDDDSPSLTGPAGPDSSSLGQSSDLERLVAALNISGLRKKAKESKDSDEGILADRQIQRIMVGLVEISGDLLAQKKFHAAVAALDVAAEASPESPWVLFSLARALALSGKKARALKTLGTAVEKGLVRHEQIENERAFDILRDDPKYKALIEKLQGTGDPAGGTH